MCIEETGLRRQRARFICWHTCCRVACVQDSTWMGQASIMQNPGSKAGSNTSMPQADAQHAASHHNALTISRTSTTTHRSPSAAGSSQHSPASSQLKAPGTANLADSTLDGLPSSETAQTPLAEHTRASQNHSCSKPQQIGGTEQMEAHLGFLSSTQRRCCFYRLRK